MSMQLNISQNTVAYSNTKVIPGKKVALLVYANCDRQCKM